jgi:mannosyl-3-phosphoglycerate phosphatase
LSLIFFTDLDGTLLDHQTYDFSPAAPALAALEAQGIPLVLATSKTGPEVSEIRAVLGLEQWPAIVENGAGELPPGASSSVDDCEYRKLRRILDNVPAELRRCYRGFGDMTDKEVAAVTGLSVDSARLARTRAYTEPGVFTGSDDQRAHFTDTLEKHSVSARDGGRFLTLSFGRTKADGLRAIAERMHASNTVALGDAPNDRDMLLAANFAVVVRNDHGPALRIPGAHYTEQPGPAGWNTAVLSLLESPRR